jgi:uncharacterized iron-regulated protein
MGYRVLDTRSGAYLDLAGLTRAVENADVVFFGENHDDPVAHRLQLDLLDRLSRESRAGALGMEMFERDVQPLLARYIAGQVSETDFLGASRPWSNYRTDYRPLVELAKERGWEVLGTNLPQSQARSISGAGIEALAGVSAAERRWAAQDIQCPADAYWDRFVGAMFEEADSAAAAAAHAVDNPMLRRTFEAQCARDETMAESIAQVRPGTRVFHVNGGFHTDYRQGIVSRLLRREPNAVVKVITAIPVDDLGDPPIAEHLDRADYVVFTRKAG